MFAAERAFDCYFEKVFEISEHMDAKCSKLSKVSENNSSHLAHFRHARCERAETPPACSCQIHTYRTYRVLCALARLRDLSIHHSPWSAVSRGEDGSSKLGPCG